MNPHSCKVTLQILALQELKKLPHPLIKQPQGELLIIYRTLNRILALQELENCPVHLSSSLGGGGGGPANSLQNTEPPPNTPSPPVIPPSNTNHSSRLPKLNLPTFSGNLLNWSTVRDSFEAAVHSNTTLGAVQKFSYLKAGNASRAIAGFPLNNINYEQAVKLLKERQSIKKFATVL